MRTIVLRLCGHSAGGPSAVLDQSNARMRTPISPPLARKTGDCTASVSFSVVPDTECPFFRLSGDGKIKTALRRNVASFRAQRDIPACNISHRSCFAL